MFVNKLSHISRAHISESKTYFDMKLSIYCFHMKTKIMADFQICIRVPLTYSYILFSVSRPYRKTTVAPFPLTTATQRKDSI